MDEAAQIDGANTLQVIYKIAIPLMMPAMVTMFMINFIISWNEFMYPLILTIDKAAKTATVAFTEIPIPSEYYTPWENISAMGVMMIVPVVIIVLVFQKKIVAGLTAGALK